MLASSERRDGGACANGAEPDLLGVDRADHTGSGHDPGGARGAQLLVAAVQRRHALDSPVVPTMLGTRLARKPSTKTPAKKVDPHADLVTATGNSDWAAAAKILAKFKQDDALKELHGLDASHLADIDNAAAGAVSKQDAELLHRRISFLQHGPADAAVHADEVTVKKAGKKGDAGKVTGGSVDVRTDVEFEMGGTDYTGGFSLGYSGKEAERTRWLQFIWREVVVEKPEKKPTRLDDSITTTGGTYKLTTDPDKPSYNTDSSDASSPFYEAGFINNRTADATTMFDLPGPMTAKITPLFSGADKASRVTSRAHFTTYLVRGMDVLYKAKIDVEWIYTDATEPPRKQSTRSAGKTSKLEAGHRARLIDQYPDFDYLP